ncbi:MAG: peptidase T [Ignavibacteria bacterium]|nr:peptidase T [Ignavibacteria bacterium]
MFKDYKFTCVDRFLKYVQVDTQSDPNSVTYPSTEKQKDLAKILVAELLEMGIKDANMDEYGYVFGTIESNTDKKVPVICFCSHMDTSPDLSGENVKPIVHNNYRGGNITLPGDKTQVLTPEVHAELKNQIGNDIITSDGTTLLGADNKAGVAEIMDAANYLLTHPEIKHGKIRILFTPDEEVGRGVEKLDMAKLAADYGYTMDGDKAGCVEDETFSADSVTIKINGVITHPGSAYGKMENAIKIASDIIAALPKDTLSPETTKGLEGFIHPVSVKGGAEYTEVKFIIRDFVTAGLADKENILKNITDKVLTAFPNSSYEFIIEESYRNMNEVLKNVPFVTEYAFEAVKRAGLTPFKKSVRGGTDGSKLSFMGLPCPNVFAGEHGIHSKQEWCSVQDMQKAVETIVHLCMIWEEKAKPNSISP